MAIDQRRPNHSPIIHSDQGTQFTSWAFTRRALDSGLLPSMGSIGDCFDNAVMESFWSRVQVELLDRKRWRTRVELANAIFDYLEIFHNRQRRHSSLGVLTPVEFEARSRPTTAIQVTELHRSQDTPVFDGLSSVGTPAPRFDGGLSHCESPQLLHELLHGNILTV